jgi:hypothetical protein
LSASGSSTDASKNTTSLIRFARHSLFVRPVYPSFFNRIDTVVTFGPLSTESIHAITRMELADVAAGEGLSQCAHANDTRAKGVPRLLRRQQSPGEPATNDQDDMKSNLEGPKGFFFLK